MDILINYLTEQINKPLTKLDACYILEKNGYLKDNQLTDSGKELVKLIEQRS